ncbi:hypothetical protein JKP88DRAFT_254306 [Tribonema minus]|uniref:Uncharacterized protein n=1 Tax=Tribonema minus TaxID=303371 RepID=A0A836CHP4_9STRA|nr:hypothetical protein JKP88DRAFT_254306 [Tribonema minus]
MPEEVAYESIDDLEAATDAFHKIDSRQPDGEDPVEPQAAKTLSYQSLKELNAPLKFGDYPATEHETASDEQDLEDGESSDGSPRYLTGSYQHGETCEEEALYFEDYMPAGAEFPPLHAVHAQASHQTPCCDVFGANSRLRSGGGGAAHAQWVSDVCGLGRSIRALAVVDGCVLLASAVLLFWGPWFPMVFGLFCWGPIAGCWSGHRYSLPAARAYFVYYLFKGRTSSLHAPFWSFRCPLQLSTSPATLLQRLVLLYPGCTGADLTRSFKLEASLRETSYRFKLRVSHAHCRPDLKCLACQHSTTGWHGCGAGNGSLTGLDAPAELQGRLRVGVLSMLGARDLLVDCKWAMHRGNSHCTPKVSGGSLQVRRTSSRAPCGRPSALRQHAWEGFCGPGPGGAQVGGNVTVARRKVLDVPDLTADTELRQRVLRRHMQQSWGPLSGLSEFALYYSWTSCHSAHPPNVSPHTLSTCTATTSAVINSVPLSPAVRSQKKKAFIYSFAKA